MHKDLKRRPDGEALRTPWPAVPRGRVSEETSMLSLRDDVGASSRLISLSLSVGFSLSRGTLIICCLCHPTVCLFTLCFSSSSLINHWLRTVCAVTWGLFLFCLFSFASVLSRLFSFLCCLLVLTTSQTSFPIAMIAMIPVRPRTSPPVSCMFTVYLAVFDHHYHHHPLLTARCRQGGVYPPYLWTDPTKENLEKSNGCGRLHAKLFGCRPPVCGFRR